MGGRTERREEKSGGEEGEAKSENRDGGGRGGEEGGRQGKHKGKHGKPKPWDTPDIDHWKLEPFDPKCNEGGMLEESSFSTLFPQYREKYLREAWPLVTRALNENGISCELNLVEGSMTVKTTRRTRDPFIIIKARDLMKLLSRSVHVAQAVKILDDDMQCDIIKIGSLLRNKERFVKRRQRLLGPNGATTKAIELLTGCYMLVQGNTVSAMGSYKGLKTLRRIVEDCIKNVHPIYHIKALMIKRELAKDPALADENWDRFLPKFKKRNVKRNKPKAEKKKPYTPFPPPQQPRKVDLQIESGEYFLSTEMKAAKKWDAKTKQQEEKVAERKQKREAAYVPPKESKKPSNTGEGEGIGTRSASKSDVTAMADSLKKKVQSFASPGLEKARGIEDYVVTPTSTNGTVKENKPHKRDKETKKRPQVRTENESVEPEKKKEKSMQDI